MVARDQASGASGTGWATPWRGRFLCVQVSARAHHVEKTFARARREVHSNRPTRIVLVLHNTHILPHCTQGAEVTATSASGDSTIVLFQNALAEAVSPCRAKLPSLWQSLDLTPTQGSVQRARRLPANDIATWLDRANREPSRLRLNAAMSWFDCISISAPRLEEVPIVTNDAKRAQADLMKLDSYVRRIGVLPDSYRFLLGDVMHHLTSVRPTLKQMEEAIETVRSHLWTNAYRSFNIARASRDWVRSSDPLQLLQRSDEDRLAQLLFERDQETKRDSDAFARKARGRKRKRSQSNGDTQHSRRSARPRKRRLDPEFYWNFGDTYVKALDERPGRSFLTSGNIHTLHSRRRSRKKRPLSAPAR